MDSPNPRWDLERAVLAARVPPNAKLIMLTLLAKTDGSSLVLVKYSPSTYTLAGQTGLKRDTVVKYIALLELHGWLAVQRHARNTNRYTLAAGRAFATSPNKGTSPAVAGSAPSPHNGASASPHNGASASPHNGASASPHIGTDTDRSDLSDQSDKERFFLADSSQAAAGSPNGFKPPTPPTPSPPIPVLTEAAREALLADLDL